jgi:transcriptional regulator with XRE-family HTH domain
VTRPKTPTFASPAAIFASRVGAARQARGWTQQMVADRLQAMGFPISRAVLSEIEDPTRKRSQRVTLNDVFAISYVLGVAPVHMVVPLEDDGPLVAITPDAPVDSSTARRWIRGDIALDDPSFYDTQKPVQERDQTQWAALRELKRCVDDLAVSFPQLPSGDDEELANFVLNVRVQLELVQNKLDGLLLEMRKIERHCIQRGLIPQAADPLVPVTTPIAVQSNEED